MNIGVLTTLFHDKTLDETLAALEPFNLDAVEIGTGGNPAVGHLPAEGYLADEDGQEAVAELLETYGLEVSAFATHNNPLHPDADVARKADEDLRNTIDLANSMDVGTVTCFSGLPGAGPDADTTKWITYHWPNEDDEEAYQWEQAIDYWSEIGGYADERDINIAIEMHPKQLVYNPPTMRHLREATHDRVGANFDPSHFYWQGIDIEKAISYLGDAIYHVHAKDTYIDEEAREVTGVMSSNYLADVDRPWEFCTVGYGHGEEHWKSVARTLRDNGYDETLSIEHEDPAMSGEEGLEKAVEFLERVVPRTQPGDTYWQ